MPAIARNRGKDIPSPAAPPSSPAETLRQYLRWYIGIRVVVVSTVLVLTTLLELTSAPLGTGVGLSFLLHSNLVYFVAGPTYFATLLYIGLLRLFPEHPSGHAYLQFLGDLALITALVHFLGGASSPFSLLYLIIIAVASALLSRRAGLTVASLSFLLHCSVAFGLIPALDPSEVIVGYRLGINLGVHCFGFYAMALLTSYLSRNVTRAERELEAKSEDLADLQVVHRDVIQSITSGLITTDLEGIITSANQAALAILGRAEPDLLGQPIQRSGLIDEERWMESTAASTQRWRTRVEVDVVRGSGDIRHVGFSLSQLKDAEGNHRGYIVIFQDLTNWRRMQEELRMKDRMAAVGELAAGLAHEIGNPLAAISGSVQMLSSRADENLADRRLIEILLKESQRLDRTIKGFLRYARPRERASVPFDVAHQLTENFELITNSEEVSTEHHLELDLKPDSVQLLADPDHVSQIFWNLARNALRAMPRGGTLRVAGRVVDGYYRLEFSDTGSGMSEEQRANLFHPYQSFFDGGTGLGMAIVYRIVQDHGGRISVDSHPGGGTVLRIELPLAGASPVSRTTPSGIIAVAETMQ
jgi:two-component system sensor histidine kinase PilS (NtrC family)